MNITPALLQQAVGCTAERAALFAPHLAEACTAYQIDTPARLAAFFAQIGHESGSLRCTSEVWGPTPAQLRYEGRADLGNTQPGDGSAFAGHGLIQTTGRANHRAVRDRLLERGMDCPDFEANPSLLTTPKWASWSAADYWDMRGLNALADAGEIIKIGRAINRGNALSQFPANGEADRLQRWERAKSALAAMPADPGPTEPPIVHLGPEPVAEPAPRPSPAPRPDQEPYTQEPEARMPLPIAAIVSAFLPSVIEAIPKLGSLFGSGSKVAERNVAAAGAVMNIVQQATGAINAQEAVERINSDPAMLAAATRAVEAQWYTLTESGGGGIDGARKADAAAMAADGPWWQVVRSPSFVVALLLLPMVYLILGNVTGLYGAEWSPDARAGIAGSIAGGIVMGLIGYYYGQTTSRNRTPAAPGEST